MRRLSFNAGRGLGALTGALLAVLWVYTMWAPGAGLGLSGISLAIGFTMVVIAVVAIIAAVRGHGTMLMIAFLASFLPVGALLVQAADPRDRWIGVLDLALLAAAALVHFGNEANQR
ncbi:hypothetical protein [Candidatus Rariloculus sp.]|uniref:hypothetical protein n=1 Tax=Candidatus Rariloculus sp. TaxID=3101265 RepID=UPI003D0EDF3C